MKILSLKANFGKLAGETLTLSEGLNVITLPNESGKSTWSQFILAMLYGIDTSERAKAGTLPAKTKYKPWSGASMQGSMDIEWNGRRITLERTSSGRGLMNNLRAFETDSGLPVAELTAENCGKTLLGVERSVFERSAFIRQTGIAVTQDSALEQRLQALVTTGDEGASYLDAEKILRDRRNQLGRSRTGQLDRLAPELEQVERQLDELSELGKSVYTLQQTEQQLLVQQQDLQRQRKLSEAHETAAKLQQLKLSQDRANMAQQALQSARQECEELPSEATLAILEQQLYHLPQQPTLPGDAPTAPHLPDALQGMDEPQIRKAVNDDLATLDSLAEVKKPSMLLTILSGLFSIAGIAAVFFNLPLGLGLVAIGQVLLQSSLHQNRKAKATIAQQAQTRNAILQKYSAASRDEIVQLSERCCAELALYTRQLEQYNAACAAHEQAQRVYDQAHRELLTQFSAFCAITDLSQARGALREVQAKYELLRRAESEYRQATDSYVNLKSALGELAEPDPILLQRAPDRSAQELAREEAMNSQQLLRVRSQLDQLSGRRSAIGNADALSARQEVLCEQREALQLHVQALDIALTALNEANREVQTRISPALARLASEYLGELTDGRYDKVQLDADFSAAARLSGEVVHQSLSYLSAGTADQLYLSVRLAICELTLQEHHAPMILDDALAFFDDTRCSKALELLQKISQERQILLFTCQGREEKLLS